VWQRHDLETMKKRLKAFEAKVAQDGVILSEAQLAALEKAKSEKDASSKASIPAIARAQDTLYVGNMKGGASHLSANLRGHLFESRLRQALRSQDAAHGCRSLGFRSGMVDVLDGEIELVVVMLGIAAVFRSAIGQHALQFYAFFVEEGNDAVIQDPQTNGIVERFHKTILNEFYRIAFRKKLYGSIEELQADLDRWLEEFNCNRPHQADSNLASVHLYKRGLI